MSVQVLGVCYFLHAPVHLKRISKGSFQYFQYCELEDFPFQHLHFITHVRACVLEEKEGGKKRKWQSKREKTITNRMSSRKWSLVNKGEMELIFQMCIRVPFLGGRKQAQSEQSESSGTICH